MIIKEEIVLPNIYAITYDSQYDLCMAFVRMQEFYESSSSKFRGKYFTLEDYMDYWASEFGNGVFDYTVKWNGFNLPSKVVHKWIDLFGDSRPTQPLRDREEEILEVIGELGMQEGCEGWPEKYYVIGVHTEKSEKYRQEAIEHECAHALYYLYPAYKKACNKLISKMDGDRIDKALAKLLKMGYGKNVLKDELQAYFSTEEKISTHKGLGGIKEFAQNFKEYKAKWVEKNNLK